MNVIYMDMGLRSAQPNFESWIYMAALKAPSHAHIAYVAAQEGRSVPAQGTRRRKEAFTHTLHWHTQHTDTRAQQQLYFEWTHYVHEMSAKEIAFAKGIQKGCAISAACKSGLRIHLALPGQGNQPSSSSFSDFIMPATA